MVRTLDAQPWYNAGAVLGEGPSWDARSGQLSWVDILSATVHVADADGRPVADLPVPSHVGAALPAAAGGWLVALADRLAHLGTDGSLDDVVPLEAHLPDNRANDAKCDPTGRAWVGTMNYDERSFSGSLYRLGPGPELSAVVDRVGIANGLGWSPDTRTMYFIDTLSHQVRAYPFEPATGSLGAPTSLAHIDEADGSPDGLCTDDDGCLWVALWGGGRVHRYTPDGTLDTVVRLPVTYVTSCCFGGADRDRLFITTASRDLDAEGRRREPWAGGVWVAEPGIGGPPATPWQG
jgi:sugar lactone lactonase YvrE